MATAELRDRVRERLVGAEQGLERVLAGAAPDRDDRVARAARRRPARGGRAAPRAASPRAVADFDAATIVTTHGFCQEVLGGLGIAGDLEPGITFVEDLRDLVEEVVDDLYVRAFHARDEVLFDRAPGAADRARRRRQPGRAARAARPGDGPAPARAPAAGRRACARSSRSASAASAS